MCVVHQNATTANSLSVSRSLSPSLIFPLKRKPSMKLRYHHFIVCANSQIGESPRECEMRKKERKRVLRCRFLSGNCTVKAVRVAISSPSRYWATDRNGKWIITKHRRATSTAQKNESEVKIPRPLPLENEQHPWHIISEWTPHANRDQK